MSGALSVDLQAVVGSQRDVVLDDREVGVFGMYDCKSHGTLL